MTHTTIETSRIRLVPFSMDHLTNEYVSWLNDKDLMRYSEQRHKGHTVDSCRKYWLSFQNTSNFFWAIEALDLNNTHIGNINAYVDINNGLADLGLLIGHSFGRHKGYGLLSWSTALEYLLTQHNVRKVSAGTMATNLGMRSIAEKSGMTLEGIRPKHFLCDGEEVDMLYYGKFKAQASPEYSRITYAHHKHP